MVATLEAESPAIPASSGLRYALPMQRTATRVFVISSVAFGAIGSLFFVSVVGIDAGPTVSQTLFAAWGVAGCAVLSSFAVSVAGKYLMAEDDQVTR